MILLKSFKALKPFIRSRAVFRGFSNYQENLFRFEENWKEISDEKNKELDRVLEEELTKDQKDYITALSRAFTKMTVYEVQYFYELLFSEIEKMKGPPTMSLIMDWPTVKKNRDYLSFFV